ncbi:MAG: hypothetical protein CSB44_05935 [Gammaproteobacteria bacterium]|nr:MAG: hypothetical protein CSB44_05935 [Gammaproteobacteria bacterium]PIE37036.1 MAG: hypothetical protein CSA54_02275 [Gammaproteobacteria bacterium]
MSSPAQQRHALIAVAALLAAALACVAWTAIQDTRRIAANTPPPLIAGIDTIRSIRIEREARDTIAIELGAAAADSGAAEPEAADPDAVDPDAVTTPATGDSSNTMRIVAPCELIAQNERVQPLLDALAGARAEHDAATVDRDAAGLASSTLHLELDGETLTLGGPDLSGERHYVEYQESVGFVPTWVTQLLDGGLSAFANLDVIPPDTTELEIDTGESTMSLTPEANAEAFARWRDLTARQVVRWPLADQDAPEWLGTLVARSKAGSDTQTTAAYGSFIALVSKDGQCARLVAREDWPADAAP